MWVIVWVNVQGVSLLGVLTLRGFPCWDSASLETRCDERPNDHLLLFVSKSTKQHLFLRACSEFAVMDVFWKLFSWRSDGIFTARVTFTILREGCCKKCRTLCSCHMMASINTCKTQRKRSFLYCLFVTLTHLKPVQSTEYVVCSSVAANHRYVQIYEAEVM